jgi:hypothetical protein
VLTCESENLCVTLPVKAGWALARERLPSCREPASRNPRAIRWSTVKRSRARAPFRLLPIRAPRQAVLRTSSWLAPSRVTNRPCDLPVEKTRDASDRFLPPKRNYVYPHLVRSRFLMQLSLRGSPTESKAPRGKIGGPDVSRRPSPLRRIVSGHVCSSLLPYGGWGRAWAYCSHGAMTIEPLTPLSRPPFILAPHPPSRALPLHRPSLFWRGSDGSEDAETTKTTLRAVS